MMTCKNCGNTVIGNYCSNCGQSTKVDNINLSNFITEVSNSIFQIDKGFFFTIKELFVRPGHSIRGFINGKRKNHFKPIAFILTLSTIYFLISKISDGHTIIDSFLAGASDAGDKHNLNTSSSNLVKWISNNYAYTALLLLPVFSFATYISFVDFKKNYLEHIVINAYITGQQTIFYTLFLILGVLIDNEDITVLFATIIAVLFNFWVFYQFFFDKRKLFIILRLVLAYFIYYVFVSLLLTVFVIERMMNL